MSWGYEIDLPSGGTQVSIAKPHATVEPMGDTGVRIKWSAKTRREVRVSVEPAIGEGLVFEMVQLASQFGAELVSNAEIDDGEGQLFVLREVDPKRHIVVATRGLRNNYVTQISMEASGRDPREVADEWAVVSDTYDSLKTIRRMADGPQLTVRPTSSAHRIRFELPPDVYIAQWAYGMAQLKRRGNGDLGPMAYAALAADDTAHCLAAFEALADDPGLSGVQAFTDEDTAVLQAELIDSRGIEATLLAGAQPLGRGVALVVATLFLTGGTDEVIVDVLNHALESAEPFGRARKPRASPDARTVLANIDSFRHRVGPNGARIVD